MQIQKIIFIGILSIMTACNAFALENVGGIQITPLLKTTTSWNGTPIQYPEAKRKLLA